MSLPVSVSVSVSIGTHSVLYEIYLVGYDAADNDKRSTFGHLWLEDDVYEGVFRSVTYI